MSKRNDLRALRNLITQAQDLLMTTVLLDGRSQRANELLSAAVHLADDLLQQSPAATLGKKGGMVTAQKGSEYFRKLAAKRKEFKGGRPSGKSKPQ